ncbi:hypothetical protein NBRC116597_44770 [Phaeobacter sp. NW0010-22]
MATMPHFWEGRKGEPSYETDHYDFCENTTFDKKITDGSIVYIERQGVGDSPSFLNPIPLALGDTSGF